MDLEATQNRQFDMFMAEVVRPIFGVLTGWGEHLLFKATAMGIGIGSMLALDLFSTPEHWWKALMWLVVMDWVSGVIVSIYHAEFKAYLMTRKAYSATGYIMVCGGAAIIANAMPEIFYYAQFLVYAAFFAREFYSILRHWRVWAFLVAVARTIYSGKSYMEKFDGFVEAIEQEQERLDEESDNPKN